MHFQEEGTRLGIDLWLMNADGSNQRNLSGTAGRSDVELKPQWSPDGKKLLCISFDMSGNIDVHAGRLKVITVATGASTFLTSTPDVASAFWGR